MLDNWLYLHCQFVGNESFADFSRKREKTLRSDIVAMLRQRSANVTKLRSLNFTKCLKLSFQRYVKLASTNILVFLGKLPLWEKKTMLKVRLEFLHHWIYVDA